LILLAAIIERSQPMPRTKKPAQARRKPPEITTAQAAEVLLEYGRLSTDATERKAIPLCTGFLDYFPDACAEVAHLSKIGNDQHNPGEPLHWARGKSADEADTIIRHLVDRGTIDKDGVRHSTKVAWRAMANLQKELEEAYGLPISRGSQP
jgi:Domain of unknown function (DUF5664)